MSWLGLDIGGANLKIADGRGYARSAPFPLWSKPDLLAPRLEEMLARAPQSNALAVTMTGELADCFDSKSEGVEAIIAAVEQAAAQRTVRVYLCDGRLVMPSTALAQPLLAAASNWHVLATFALRYCRPRPGLLIDIGSTTCDIIPLGVAGPETTGMTDPERLAAGELVYTGIRRSPVCAVVSQLCWRGVPCPVAQEVFATTCDAYLVLDLLEEESDNRQTADGRPSTKACAQARLARCLCADTTMFSMADARLAANCIRTAQLELLATAARNVLGRMSAVPASFVLSGDGEFLGRKLIESLLGTAPMISISEQLGGDVSRSACAHALAVIASEGANV